MKTTSMQGGLMNAGVRIFVVGLGLVWGTVCHANGAQIATSGVGAALACQTCHGPAGEGNAQGAFPRLAALGASYLLRQLDAFATGARANPVMMPIAKALSATDRAAVSAYYAALPAPAADVPKPAASALAQAPASVGATLAMRGRWADKLPACDQCHGPGGRGVGPDFPALAGQNATYLTNQFAAWKVGTRPPGPLGLMATVARKLSEADVRAVSDHYAAQPAKADQ
jgi:cytochrome c553